jgi:hypothetical protein
MASAVASSLRPKRQFLHKDLYDRFTNHHFEAAKVAPQNLRKRLLYRSLMRLERAKGIETSYAD